MIIEFYWGQKADERFRLEILSNKPFTEDDIEKLLDEYRKEYRDYDNDGWVDFLEERGFTVRGLEPEKYIYF